MACCSSRRRLQVSNDVVGGVPVEFTGDHPGPVWYTARIRRYPFGAGDALRTVHRRDSEFLIANYPDLFKLVLQNADGNS